MSILGLAEIREGDIVLTDLGRRFEDGDILERKEVFREAVAASVVLVNQILQALRANTRARMNEEFFLELLENHFTREEAQRQLQTAIDWGRYSELFAYDEEAGLLYLEREEIEREEQEREDQEREEEGGEPGADDRTEPDPGELPDEERGER